MSTVERIRPGLVLPRWGTRRRTADEWVERGGDRKLLRPGDEWWPSIGHQVAAVATRLRLPPMPHQRHVFDVAFELDPGSPEDLWYTEAGVWVMRQCGKTMGILFPVGVHRLTMAPRRMGGRQRVAFTMQDRQETRKKLELDIIPQLVEASDSFRRITNPKGRPGRSTMEWKSSLNNGSEHLLFGQGNYFLIETPSKKAGHGSTIDVKMADEIRFGVDDRIEASSASQITRRSRQLWLASTAGDEESFYMWPKVVAGRARVGRDDVETRACSFEWALPEDADLHDPDVWYDHHPAVGHTIEWDDILDKLRQAEDSPDESKIDTFRQEYANQWIRHPVLGEVERETVVDLQMWSLRSVPADSEFVRPVTLGVSVADDGRTAAIAVAGWNRDGAAQVKVLDLKPGTFWIEQALAEYRDEWGPECVTYNAGGPTAAIEGPIARGAGRVDVEPVRGTAYTAACQAFVTGFEEARYRHLDQDWLNTAIEGAAKKLRGAAWLWDMQRSRADITPLDAATVALRALEGRPPVRRSAYEDDGLMTVGGR